MPQVETTCRSCFQVFRHRSDRPTLACCHPCRQIVRIRTNEFSQYLNRFVFARNAICLTYVPDHNDPEDRVRIGPTGRHYRRDLVTLMWHEIKLGEWDHAEQIYSLDGRFALQCIVPRIEWDDPDEVFGAGRDVRYSLKPDELKAIAYDIAPLPCSYTTWDDPHTCRDRMEADKPQDGLSLVDIVQPKIVPQHGQLGDQRRSDLT